MRGPILRLEDPNGGEPWYLEWSTISDSPRTRGMRRGEFAEYVREEYGRYGTRHLDERLFRADKHGTSVLPECEASAESLILCNRAGPDETWIGLEEIWRRYCARDGEEQIDE